MQGGLGSFSLSADSPPLEAGEDRVAQTNDHQRHGKQHWGRGPGFVIGVVLYCVSFGLLFYTIDRFEKRSFEFPDGCPQPLYFRLDFYLLLLNCVIMFCGMFLMFVGPQVW